MNVFLAIVVSFISLFTAFFIFGVSLRFIIKKIKNNKINDSNFSVAYLVNFAVGIILTLISYDCYCFAIHKHHDTEIKHIREEYQKLSNEEDYGPVFNNKYENDIIAFYDKFVADTAINTENKKDIYNQYKKLEFNRFVKATSLENLQNSTYKPLYLNINKNDKTVKRLINNITDVKDIIFSENIIQFKLVQKIPKTSCSCGKCYNIKTNFIDLIY